MMVCPGQRTSMEFKPDLIYQSHLPVLMEAVEKTDGDILELGAGIYSTPYLHWIGYRANPKRKLLTIDNDEKWLSFFVKDFETVEHKFLYVEDWDKAPIEKNWDVVFVDHAPADRRKIEIRRLADLAKYIIIHDSNGRYEPEYHYSEIYPMFKHKFDFTDAHPSTTVLSNFINLDGFI